MTIPVAIAAPQRGAVFVVSRPTASATSASSVSSTIFRTVSLSNSARASPLPTPCFSSSLSFRLVRSEVGMLVSKGMPYLAPSELLSSQVQQEPGHLACPAWLVCGAYATQWIVYGPFPRRELGVASGTLLRISIPVSVAAVVAVLTSRALPVPTPWSWTFLSLRVALTYAMFPWLLSFRHEARCCPRCDS